MSFETEFVFENLPFHEALKFIRSRVPMTEDEFNRLAREARMRAFTVSEVAGLDALSDIKESLSTAIEKGQSLAEWKKSVTDLLDQWGIGGWHAETIYRTNLQTAYQVGRYEQMMDPDVLETRPYWMYVAVMDERTRPEHAALHGKVFRADDPFWDHWYPPNGFNCRCTVHTLSETEVDREGIDIQRGKDWYGQKMPMPDGGTARLYPDAGWDFNPGKDGLFGTAAEAKLKGIKEDDENRRFESASPGEFIAYREKVPKDFQYYLSQYGPDEISEKGTAVYMNENKTAGFAIAKDGDIQNLFSLKSGNGKYALMEAIRQGGIKLDCFDGFLNREFYATFFTEYKREPNWTKGGPDVVYMKLDPAKLLKILKGS